MKTQKFGVNRQSVHFLPSEHLSFIFRLATPLLERVGLDPEPGGRFYRECADAVADFRIMRENGALQDTPQRGLPKSRKGDFTWSLVTSYADGSDDYDLRYNPRRDVFEWMAEKDCNYLIRIEKDGTLGELEPAVWYLRVRELATGTDIRQWWREKLKRTDLSQLLERADQEVKPLIPGARLL